MPGGWAEHPADLPDEVLLERAEEILATRDRLDGLLARYVELIDVRDATIPAAGHGTRSWQRTHCRRSQAEANAHLLVAGALTSRKLLFAALGAGSINHATRGSSPGRVGTCPSTSATAPRRSWSKPRGQWTRRS